MSAVKLTHTFHLMFANSRETLGEFESLYKSESQARVYILSTFEFSQTNYLVCASGYVTKKQMFSISFTK